MAICSEIKVLRDLALNHRTPNILQRINNIQGIVPLCPQTIEGYCIVGLSSTYIIYILLNVLYIPLRIVTVQIGTVVCVMKCVFS